MKPEIISSTLKKMANHKHLRKLPATRFDAALPDFTKTGRKGQDPRTKTPGKLWNRTNISTCSGITMKKWRV